MPKRLKKSGELFNLTYRTMLYIIIGILGLIFLLVIMFNGVLDLVHL